MQFVFIIVFVMVNAVWKPCRVIRTEEKQKTALAVSD